MGNINQKPQHHSKHAQEQQDSSSSTTSTFTCQIRIEPEDDQESSSSSSTFTCEICTEPVTLDNNKFNNGNICVHPFCTECIIKYIQAKLEENVSNIKCPALTCHHSLEPLSCQPKIPRKLFDKWCDVLCDSAVLEVERVYCPNRDCSALVINECGGGDKLKRCVCPNCKEPFCFRCKVAWHAGYRCEERGEIMDQNDVAFGVLSETERWMRCPKCRHCVERASGCRFIQCRCGVHFCYTCGRNFFQCKCLTTCNCRMLPLCLILLFFIVLFLYLFIFLFRYIRSVT